MIQANELRIGNLTMQGVVAEIDKDSFRVLNENNESLKSTWFEIEPIPLTEEWLAKFGFEKPSVCGSYVILYLNDENKPSSLQIPLFRKDVIQICRSGICAYESKCEYVHTLQNLYFALTGEELTIKN